MERLTGPDLIVENIMIVRAYNERKHDVSLEEALAEFEETSKIKTHNIKRAALMQKFSIGEANLGKKESACHWKTKQAIQLMQVGRKRKLMIDDDCLDSYLAEDSGCLPPEVRR